MATKAIAADAETAASASEPAVREAVIGRKMDLATLAAIIASTVVATIGIAAWVRSAVTEEVSALRVETKEGLVTLRGEIVTVRSDMKEGINELKIEIRELKK